MNKQIEEMAKCCRYYEGGMCRNPRSRRLMCAPHYCQDGVVFKKLVEDGYRRASNVAAEVLEILSELKENYLADNDVREACAISYAEIKIVALKKKYESEG